MTLRVQIGSSKGKNVGSIVDSDGSLHVASLIPDIPKSGEPNRYRYFTSVLGSGGADTGTTSMDVDGSVTPQEFFIEASPDFDIKIMAVVIIIAGQTISHNSFGSVSILTNGWDLIAREAGEDITLVDAAKTSGQVIAQAGFSQPYGSGLTSFQLTKWTANDDAHTVIIPVGEYVPEGLRIGRGTKDKVISVVNDDLTGLSEFTVRVIGYRHYPIK